jgi:hypothetical protein
MGSVSCPPLSNTAFAPKLAKHSITPASSLATDKPVKRCASMVLVLANVRNQISALNGL